LAAGALLSCVVGLASLWLLTAIVDRGRLYWFAFWLIPLGIAVVVWQLTA
jgi:undecaprenyl pyrophosphate phosphatase UppP